MFWGTYFTTLIVGFVVTLIISALVVSTKKYHGTLTLDSVSGVQKTHSAPTPRVGGISLIIGFVTVWFFLEGETRTLWGYIGLAGIPALVFGLAEDITGKVGVKWRLIATIVAGLIFSLLSGYAVTSVSMWGIDSLLSVSIFSMAFTAFAIGGVANSINIIDGFHGLASGTMMLILSAFAVISWRTGDLELMGIALAMIAIMAGFFVVNFPFGKLFLGDAGAYFSGFIIAVLAVMLPARNPEISPWISLLILWYPITETMVSIIRRAVREGASPGEPDSLHLHSLLHLTWVNQMAKHLGQNWLNNPLTGAFMWQFSVLPIIFVAYSDFNQLTVTGYLVSSIALYLGFYRNVLSHQNVVVSE